MNVYFKLLGSAMLLMFSFFASKSYQAYLQSRLEEVKGLIALLSHAEEGIGRYMLFGTALWQGFENEAMDKSGITKMLKEGEGLSAAFEKCKRSINVSEELKAKISDALACLGSGYRESEISKIKSLRTELERTFFDDEADFEKKASVTRALMLGGALAVTIMVI